jgi:hypothetical protein
MEVRASWRLRELKAEGFLRETLLVSGATA